MLKKVLVLLSIATSLSAFGTCEDDVARIRAQVALARHKASDGACKIVWTLQQTISPSVVAELQKQAKPGDRVVGTSYAEQSFDLEWNQTVWRAETNKPVQQVSPANGLKEPFDLLDFYDGNKFFEIVNRSGSSNFLPAGYVAKVAELKWRSPEEVSYSVWRQDIDTVLGEGTVTKIVNRRTAAYGPVVELSLTLKNVAQAEVQLAPERSWAVVDAVVHPSGIGKYTTIHQTIDTFVQAGETWLPAKATYEIIQGDLKAPGVLHKETVSFSEYAKLGAVPALELGAQVGTRVTDQETQQQFKVGADGRLIPVGYTGAKEMSKVMPGACLSSWASRAAHALAIS